MSLHRFSVRLAAGLVVAGTAASASAAPIIVYSDANDYRTRSNGATGASYASTSASLGVGSDNSGGTNPVFIFALPALGTGESSPRLR